MSHFKKNILDSRQQLAPERTLNRKITVFGTDPVGMACAHAIANRGLATEICILDKQSSTLTGEILDIKFGAYFMDNIKITGTYGMIPVFWTKNSTFSFQTSKSPWVRISLLLLPG